jgi:peptidoglycan hydrolase-like protein with peptidoglycan-binding domain
MPSHQEARDLACHAISLALHLDIVPEHVTRHLCGVGSLETQYGAGWRGAGKGSNNMGAIQAGAGWTGATFEYVDTHPNADGTSTPYRVAFRAYPTPLDGWVDLARVMFAGRRADVLLVASRGDTYSVSELMRATGYYEGFGPTQHDRIRNHMLALRRAVLAADKATDLAVPVLRLEGIPVGVPETVRFGNRGDAVKTLQRELQIAADGIFGRVTEHALAEYQVDHRLTPDGVCGPATWQVLLSDEYVPEAI